MRFVLIAAALALSACTPRDNTAEHAAGCARSATHEVTWSAEGAPDTITTRSDGPSCAQAVVTLVARNSAGDPLWAFASTYYDMTMGGIPPEGAPPVSDEQMEHAAERFPINPPRNKEEYYYRSIFAEYFPSDSAARSVPSVPSVACSTAEALAWDRAFKNMNDPSGRAVVGVHDMAYE